MEITPQFGPDGNGIGRDDLRNEIERLAGNHNDSRKGLFKVQPANEWLRQASKKPIPRQLFSELWFEGELCILFADTNVGKSILAVQIGDSISWGRAVQGFTLETSAQPVLYFDLELTEKQFERRYSLEYRQHYEFAPSFQRVEIDRDAPLPDDDESYDSLLRQSLEKCVIEIGAKVLIIDNITWLKADLEKAKDALRLLKFLKVMKDRHGLSILVLAHTPKRDSSKPLGENDLQGSKMLSNIIDSCFAIGKSHKDNNFRYIKQIKQRNTEQIYDGENVAICQVEKPANFLQFAFMGFGKEWEHLRQPSEQDRTDQTATVLEMHGQGKSLREIGEALGISHQTAKRLIDKAKNL